MRAVLQRVTEASVTIANNKVATIENGIVVLIGITESDNEEDIRWLSKKIINLRIFNDENNTMNKSIKDIHGDLIIVSQFTLQAATKKGNRPSFLKAAKPEIALPMYKKFISQMEQDLEKRIQTGEFGADMQVNLCNDGPVTIIIDTKNKE